MTTFTAGAPETEDHRRHRPHRWYHTTVGVAVIAAAILGFAPSLLFPQNRNAPLTPLVALHGLTTTAWLILFVAQSWLVATQRQAVHRRLGSASVVVALTVIVAGYLTVVEQTRRGFDLSGDANAKADPAGSAVFPMGDLVSFAVLIAAGLWHRRRPELHRRFMTLGTIGGMMPAVLAHFIGHNLRSMPLLLPPMVGVAFFLPALYDRIRFGRFHRVTLWGGIVLFLWANVRAAIIGPSPLWRAFMNWASQ